MTELSRIYQDIVDDPANDWAKQVGYRPLYVAAPQARVAIIAQAPGRRAQESGTPWNDASGVALRSWLGVTDEQFYDPRGFAFLPMDFFYPGKGAHGDLPPRKEFAPKWHPRVLAELGDLRLTILIGAYAQRRYLRDRAKPTLTQTVAAFREYLPGTLPIVHPSPLNIGWRSRNPWFENELIPVLRTQVRAALAPA